ncbi:hypothetical protein KEM56_004452 [Ascosphaera pollenicola]|nr:hypothetical protein KEM56_004452 [Ascosphaera pollenicola]
MNPAKTISEHKAEFIRSQVRILSAPIEPAENWREYAWIPKKKRRADEEGGEHQEDNDDEEGERDIPDKVIGDVLGKSADHLETVNSHLKQHSRSIFSTQATYHVSRQIGNLYWKQIQADIEMRGVDSVRPWEIEKGADLTSERYTHLLSQLKTLTSTLEFLQTRLNQHRKLESLLKLFERPLENIQPNLVTRDGELSGEIEKMRMLIAKVVLKMGRERREGRLRPSTDGGSVGTGNGSSDEHGAATADWEENARKNKLETILAMP